jgi:hypothetical protein
MFDRTHAAVHLPVNCEKPDPRPIYRQMTAKQLTLAQAGWDWRLIFVRRRTPLLGLAALLLLLLAPLAAASAQGFGNYQGNRDDQQACQDDVFRLCGEFVPDQDRIVACLITRKRDLSPACKVVFSRQAQPVDQGGGNRRRQSIGRPQ